MWHYLQWCGGFWPSCQCCSDSAMLLVSGYCYYYYY